MKVTINYLVNYLVRTHAQFCKTNINSPNNFKHMLHYYPFVYELCMRRAEYVCALLLVCVYIATGREMERWHLKYCIYVQSKYKNVQTEMCSTENAK